MQKIQAPTGRPVTMASRGMVAAPHSLAAEAGVWAMTQGGNAVDAAVTANAVLGVVYPHMAGLGGDAFFMLWHPGHEQPLCLNGSGRAANQVTAEFYHDRGHDAIPAHGPLAAITVPGAVAAWGDAHARWGKLPWDQLFEPAIHYADSGFPVTANLAAWLARSRPTLERYEATRLVFLPEGRPHGEGDILLQQDLAQTLRTLADDGPEAFYMGDLAEEIAAYLQEHGSPLAHQDLQNHHSDWVDPLATTYRGHTLYGFPPNSAGLEALFILNLLAGYEVQAMGDGTTQYYHLMVEAAKVALADLHGRLADPNYVSLPLAQLLSPEYAEQRRELILPSRARLPAEYAPGALSNEAMCPQVHAARNATAYIAAVDATGLTVSLIQSLHSAFGSGMVAGRTGLLLQNAGTSFSLNEEHPNRLEPGKRPAQPLFPGLAFDGGVPWLLLGASGGAGEAQTHAALVSRLVDFGHNVQQAIEAPRWLYGSNGDAESFGLSIEGRVPDSVLRQLRELGHDVKVTGDWSDLMGQAQGIIVDRERGVFHGGADPRGDGQAIGW